MRLKERIDELEFRLQSLESAMRILAGASGIGRMFDDPEVEQSMKAELAADLAERYADLEPDPELIAEEAEDMVFRLRWLLAAAPDDQDDA